MAHINSVLGTDRYPRIRVGIGDNFRRGGQVGYVLGNMTKEENESFAKKVPVLVEMIKSFGTVGPELTMTSFNELGKPEKDIEEKETNSNTPNKSMKQ